MGCPHRSHLVKTASMGPTPLSVSGALREYSLRLLSQFLIGVPRLLDRGDRVAHPAQPPPRLLRPAVGDEPHQLAADDDAVRLRRGLGGIYWRAYAEPELHRRLRLRPDPPQEFGGLRRQPLANPGDAGHGDAVDETRSEGRGLLDPRLRRGRRHER